MKKHFRLIAAIVFCFVVFNFSVMAVATTTEPFGNAGAVYVAGCPDWYPVEYYDRETKSYQGIMPQILELVEEKTGLKFVYVRAGRMDHRVRMAKNNQVEIMSGYGLNEETLKGNNFTVSKAVLIVDKDGRQTQVCFAFTEIASAELVSTVNSVLMELSPEQITNLTINSVANHYGILPWWILPAGIVAAVLLLGAVILLIVQRNMYKKRTQWDERVDPMTGIGNKLYFATQFEKYISDQFRSIYGVIFFGFDIERVNQYYGPDEAENQLRFAANELNLSSADNEIVARVSGGGFAVARPCSVKQEAESWTLQVLDRLNKYCERYGKDYHPDFRAGIYIMDQADRDSDTVLYNAQQGYHIAVSMNVSYAFSLQERLIRETEKMELKKRTMEAIDRGEFKMYLQFVVDAQTQKIIGAEALSRWDHPQRGILAPGNYIDLMESEKTVSELDFYIFNLACKQIETWETEGLHDLYISCNFTRITIDDEHFVTRIKRISDQYKFNRSHLILEITEDAMEVNKKNAFENISKCKALGFGIALDDAGSGYTSFSDLRDYPIDTVKIDRAILTSAISEKGIALLKGMISLVHSLGMKAHCEGVETTHQIDLLRQLGCDNLQGYYFYHPLPQREANRILNVSSI